MNTKKIIQHVAFIMDGNRRWARHKGVPTLMGHQKGYENLKTIADAIFDRGINVATFFAFSAENWKRSKREVTYLLNLLGGALGKDVSVLHSKGIKLKFIGDIDGFGTNMSTKMRKVMETTKRNKKGTLVIAANYGGRADILNAVRSLIAANIEPEKIIEDVFSRALTTAGLPDPDLLIRTSGEQRLSGFLPWQTVYSELYFTEKMWPDFSVDDLDIALGDYASRERRFGV
ncbi:di-trans,poly-cis-decaprenylcistransferase [Candidatus Uhrbacteria bacterium]|nr:di-trans,poly-cis-decaprenylcistransferase [Candidatus Uhrbacteria bacterium]